MSTNGIIFANLHDNNIPQLTEDRTMASVPFACRYRLIDFSLSNMVNSSITNVSIITNTNYQSLTDHIGSGKDWDLARRSGGIRIISPFSNAFANNGMGPRRSRLEALKSISNYIYEMNCDNVVLCDADSICNIDIGAMIKEHEGSRADITLAVKKINMTPEKASQCIVFSSDDQGNVTDVVVRPSQYSGYCDVGINVMVFTKRYLQSIIHDSLSRGYDSLSLDILAKNKGNYRIFRHDGFYGYVTSIEDYYETSMSLLGDDEIRKALFTVKNRSIYTKIKNSPPTSYSSSSLVKNSIIADGCVIEGSVENCLLFRGVKIGKGSVVKNSILFQNTYIGDNVKLDAVITDKNVVIRDNRALSGYYTMPFYIEKGKMI